MGAPLNFIDPGTMRRPCQAPHRLVAIPGIRETGRNSQNVAARRLRFLPLLLQHAAQLLAGQFQSNQGVAKRMNPVQLAEVTASPRVSSLRMPPGLTKAICAARSGCGTLHAKQVGVGQNIAQRTFSGVDWPPVKAVRPVAQPPFPNVLLSIRQNG